MTAAMLAISAASPIAAQSAEREHTSPHARIVNVPGHGTVYVKPVPSSDTRSQPRTVNVPGYGELYVVPVRPKDTRTPRQRCVDEEIAAGGGSPSRLTMGTIDLKCSQR
ncbi:hypothetical protein [Sphingopyxis terrae]|uniref:hypothetical protein n=1 Tax=Sphingopyxis terrae TaxID=33052 RepID=UPI000B297706|nr:hypothetical protein [Sphingopyxis terrae]